MASPPASTRTSLGQKLRARARDRWPQLVGVDVRFHGKFAYISGQLPDGTSLPLCRLRYAGYASTWGFAIYRASHDDYDDSYLPSGQPSGTPEEALDCACGLYLADPTAWLPSNSDTQQNLRACPLVCSDGQLQCCVTSRTSAFNLCSSARRRPIPSVFELHRAARLRDRASRRAGRKCRR